MSEPLKGLKITDVLGVFYREGGRLMAADELDGPRDVDEMLGRFEGREVRVLAHHRPHEPHDNERWGGGCCVLENTGRCHFGHHDNPKSIYTFNGVGVLRADGARWLLDPKEGDALDCRVTFLEGHRSQLVVTSIPNLEQIEEKVRSFDPANFENATLEDLTDTLGEMRDYIAEISKLKNDIDG